MFFLYLDGFQSALSQFRFQFCQADLVSVAFDFILLASAKCPA